MKTRIFAVAVAALTLTFSSVAVAQKPAGLPGNYPAGKPVHVIIPAGPGSGVDIITRAVFGKVIENWGGTFVPENVSANGVQGMRTVARAAPDGYTLMLGAGTPYIIATFGNHLDFDSRTAYTSIAQITTSGFMLGAYQGEPYNDLKGMIAYAKANPGKLSYGTTGVGSSANLIGEMIQGQTGIKLLQVTYKSSPQSLIDLMAGRLNLVIASTAALTAQLRAGKLKSLGITAPTRMSSIPEQSTLAEMGLPGFDYTTWLGAEGPAGMNPAVVTALNAEFNRVLSTAEMRKIVIDQGNEVQTGTPEQFRAAIISLLDKTEKIIKATGLKIE